MVLQLGARKRRTALPRGIPVALEKGFIVKGKLLQHGVANSFVAPVPIYSSTGGYLGRVIAGGPETPFHFVSTREPGKLLIDLTLLCAIDR